MASASPCLPAASGSRSRSSNSIRRQRKGLGMKEGEWVWIETHQNKNRFKRKVVFAPYLHPRVIWGNTHFHYPEKREMMERLEPNINLSHTLDGPLDPIDGAGVLRGVPCRIAKA